MSEKFNYLEEQKNNGHDQLFAQLVQRGISAGRIYNWNKHILTELPRHREVYEIGNHDWKNLKGCVESYKDFPQYVPPPLEFYLIADSCLNAMEYGSQGVELPKCEFYLDDICANATGAAKYLGLEQQNFQIQNTGSSIPISGKKDLMTIAIFTMLENATKFGAKNVTVHLNTDHKKVGVRVEDDGRGIHPDGLTRIKEYRFSTSGSTGLGLYMVDTFFREMGGQVNVNNIIEKETMQRKGFVVDIAFPIK